MISFRNTKQSFEKNTFITAKKTPIAKTLNSFGYIKHITKNGVIIVDWYDNCNKAELKFKKQELIANYKSIYPYYNTKTIRGNIWKHSYLTLLQKINKETGFSKITVDKMTYKKTAYKGNNVVITDAVYVLSNNISKLEGKVVDYYNDTKEFLISTLEGEFIMCRNSFTLLPQDYFILLSIRCN